MNLKRFISNRRGQGMVEYILVLVIVVAIVMVGKQFFNDKAKAWMEKVGEQISGAISN
ncbi:MAG: hypothetical protein N2578_02325 [Bdellovibrionaceae bacterium]|nr:hypothetical protein [Pseudobdellovibrionaceae bacterium]